MVNKLTAPVPNLTYISRCLIHYIANHPFIINPIVEHPLSGEKIGINAYRNFNGLEVRNGLTCSVFPYTGGSDIPSPGTSSVSGTFQPYDLGNQGLDIARFHIAIKYSYNETILGKTTEMEVPTSAIFGVGQKLLTSNTKKNVTLEINPGIEIIQHYLALTKYMIDDHIHRQAFPFKVNSFEMLYQNVKSKRWEEDDTVYFQEGVAMTLFEAYMTRGWRDSLLPQFARTPIITTTIN